MVTYKKNYIGKGTQNANFENVVKMTLKVEDVLKFKHEYEVVEYITFEMGPLKATDKFGRTYTAWVSSREEVETVAESKPVPKRKKRVKPEPADEALPF